jgi:phage virion morphogenesis protein
VIEFAANVQRMARVHHYDLRDQSSRKGKEVSYEARPLLGLTNKDLDVNEKIMIEFLSQS